MKKRKAVLVVLEILLLLSITTYVYIFKSRSVENTKSNSLKDNIIISKNPNKEIETITKIIKENNTTKIITEKVKETSTTKNVISKQTTSAKTNKTTTGEKTTEKNLHEENMNLINSIYNTYGYKVSYNDESFWYNGSEAEALTNEKDANDALKSLKSSSSKFPAGFFKTIKKAHGYRVLLFSNLNGAEGVSSYEFGDDYVLALDVHTSFPTRVFYHETWHIIEKYINYNGGSFDSWNSLNPTIFSYGDDSNEIYTILNCNYTNGFNCNDPIENVSFVSLYAKSSGREDRAELFADLMFRPYQKDYMKNGFGINNKAKSLALTIRNYIPNAAGSNWEKWITW